MRFGDSAMTKNKPTMNQSNRYKMKIRRRRSNKSHRKIVVTVATASTANFQDSNQVIIKLWNLCGAWCHFTTHFSPYWISFVFIIQF